LHLFPVCIASLLFSYSANSHKCVIKLSVSVKFSQLHSVFRWWNDARDNGAGEAYYGEQFWWGLSLQPFGHHYSHWDYQTLPLVGPHVAQICFWLEISTFLQ